MPVLGHAFVGFAIGVSTKPSARGHSEPPVIGAASALWLPAVVIVAYLPDIVAQLGVIAGWSESRLLGHSVLFAVPVSPAVAAVLMRLARVSFPRAFATALVSLLVHDVLDLGQATDRAPWWPLSDRLIGSDRGLIPTGLLREAAVFGGYLWRFSPSATGRAGGRGGARWTRRPPARAKLPLSGWAARSSSPSSWRPW